MAEMNEATDACPVPRQVKRSPEGSDRNSLRSLHLLEESHLSLVMRSRQRRSR